MDLLFALPDREGAPSDAPPFTGARSLLPFLCHCHPELRDQASARERGEWTGYSHCLIGKVRLQPHHAAPSWISHPKRSRPVRFANWPAESRARSERNRRACRRAAPLQSSPFPCHAKEFSTSYSQFGVMLSEGVRPSRNTPASSALRCCLEAPL